LSSTLEELSRGVLSGLYVRPNSWDLDIAKMVMLSNEYRLPDAFHPTDNIIDIGAHIGSFSLACAIRGAKKIIGFEPEASNARLARANTEGFTIEIREQAVWRSDFDRAELRHTGPTVDQESGMLNTGGGNVFFDGYIPVDSVTLDSVIKELGKVRLLKVDCESSEWPILLTSKELDKVQEIIGEYHEIGGPRNSLATIPPRAQVGNYDHYDVDVLVDFMKSRGFTIEVQPSEGSHFGHFYARR
jgi:FkbM family methyltransferase